MSPNFNKKENLCQTTKESLPEFCGNGCPNYSGIAFVDDALTHPYTATDGAAPLSARRPNDNALTHSTANANRCCRPRHVSCNHVSHSNVVLELLLLSSRVYIFQALSIYTNQTFQIPMYINQEFIVI